MRDDEHGAFVGIEVLVGTRPALELHETGVVDLGAAPPHVSIQAFLVRGDAYALAFRVVDLSRSAEAARAAGRALLCGPVSYLPPSSDGGHELHRLHALGTPHRARPVPAEDELVCAGDHALFWSLSFAVTRATWRHIGGFCEAYDGYGGEDTDFGQLACRAGVDLCWVGGAWAYHQHHPTPSPPVDHLDDILRNATLFHSRWGWWPMAGWLTEFARAGLVRYDRRQDRWERQPGPALNAASTPGRGGSPASERK